MISRRQTAACSIVTDIYRIARRFWRRRKKAPEEPDLYRSKMQKKDKLRRSDIFLGRLFTFGCMALDAARSGADSAKASSPLDS